MASFAHTFAQQGISSIKKQQRQSQATRAFKNDRPGVECMWYPGATPPAHLDGSLPADYGFDPFSLGQQEDALRWYREAELYNGRVAMMAVVGILFTDYFSGANWWEAGAKADSPVSTPLLLGLEALVFAGLEYKRYENFKKSGVTGFLGFAPFDPLGMNSEENAVKEIKNGRLAMLAFLGIVIQTFIRGKGPVACLYDHLADPMANNLYTSWIAPGFIWYTFMLLLVPMVKEWELWYESDEKNKNTNLFNDSPVKTRFLYGILLAPFMVVAFNEQLRSGIEAYKAAGL